MPKIIVIDCKAEGPTIAFPFAPGMFSKFSAAGNMSVFEDLVIRQMSLEKDDIR